MANLIESNFENSLSAEFTGLRMQIEDYLQKAYFTEDTDVSKLGF